MSHDDILELFRSINVLRQGHFHLTSGRHSDRFLLCSQLTMHPEATERIVNEIAVKVVASGVQPNLIIGPAMGGIILAYELARILGCRAMFAEKEGDGMAMKRGFVLQETDKVLIIEDAVSTGGSVRKVVDIVEASPAELVGVAVLIDRTMGQLCFGDVPFISLLQMQIDSWTAEECPLCQQGVPLVYPKA